MEANLEGDTKYLQQHRQRKTRNDKIDIPFDIGFYINQEESKKNHQNFYIRWAARWSSTQ